MSLQNLCFKLKIKGRPDVLATIPPVVQPVPVKTLAPPIFSFCEKETECDEIAVQSIQQQKQLEQAQGLSFADYVAQYR